MVDPEFLKMALQGNIEVYKNAYNMGYRKALEEVKNKIEALLKEVDNGQGQVV